MERVNDVVYPTHVHTYVKLPVMAMHRLHFRCIISIGVGHNINKNCEDRNYYMRYLPPFHRMYAGSCIINLQQKSNTY